MANNLTGDYGAVLQISVRQINGILATMHQNKVNPAASPSFAHAASIRIGDDSRLSIATEASRFTEWMTEAAKEVDSALAEPSFDLRSMLLRNAPGGVAGLIEQHLRDLDTVVVESAPAGAYRGHALIQISIPTLSVPPGAVSEVMVHAHVRARYLPDTASAPLPEPIHGEIRSVYTIAPVTLQDGTAVLRVKVSQHDHQIQFVPHPAAGLTAAEANTITIRVRDALRKQFAPLDVPLPPQFPFVEFGAIGTGAAQTLVIPLHLPGSVPGGGTVASVTSTFIGASDFAVAVSKEFIQAAIDVLVETIKTEASKQDEIYTPRFTGPTLTWKAGSFDVFCRIDFETDTIAPNAFISFTQTFTIALDPVSQSISISALGDPTVDESWFLPHFLTLDAVKTARDKALENASKPLNKTFTDARTTLQDGLRKFDSSASVTFTEIEVTPDGIVVRGSVRTNSRLNPVVHFEETDGGDAFSAFRCWIPGGRITEFIWTWVEMVHPIPWFNKTKSIRDEHRFVCPKPAGLALASRICLRIEGNRISPDGFEDDVSAGETCKVTAHEPILVVPPWWTKVMVPIWVPDPPDLLMEDFISAHVNLASGTRAPGRLTPNVLVHFAGPRVERPLMALSAALANAVTPHTPVLAVLVLPVGTFRHRRSSVEARLGDVGERFPGHLLITEDYEGGWTRAFSAPDGPATYLMNGHGQWVWSSEGNVDGRRFAAELREHLVPAPAPQNRPLKLAVKAGEYAPDTRFTDDTGNDVALRRLGGRPVMITFWQSWSSPSLKELRRAQRLQEEGEGPLILAVNGGEDPGVVAEVRHREHLSIAMIPDPRQQIAALYGVSCWPTTVSINSDGVIDRIQFGASHTRASANGREQEGA